MEFDYTDSVSPGIWRSFLNGGEGIYFFHTPEWAKVMEEAFGYRVATRLYHTPEGDVLIPMMESRRFGFSVYQSVPHGYGGILSSSGLSTDFLMNLIGGIVGGRHLLLDLTLPPGIALQAGGASGVTKTLSEWNYTHILRLDDPGSMVEERYNRHARRDIRIAERNHVEIVRDDSLAQFQRYYALYEQRAREWGYPEPPYPWAVYDLLYRYGRPYVRVRLAEMYGEVIGGLVTFEYADTVFAWSNAAPAASRPFCPVHLLLHDALQSAQKEGYSLVNFGGSGNLLGVRKFKESFGAVQVDIETYRIASRLASLARTGWWPASLRKSSE
ncbi:MAG: GNAT family N-acetyltransferase [Methanoculleus sp.]|nr:GNAT family N-acetyltransferase [Methanoculleus sp.]